MIAKRTAVDWQELAATSHYQTAVAVQEALRDGNVSLAALGIQELVDALAKSERRALKSQLVRLMLHVIKWQLQPEHRTRGWTASIGNARDEIGEIQEETPSLTRAVIEEMWDRAFATAKREAAGELNQDIAIENLTWEQVFEAEYRVE